MALTYLSDPQCLHERYDVIVFVLAQHDPWCGRVSRKAVTTARCFTPITGVRRLCPAAQKTPGIFLEHDGLITDALAS